MNTRSQDRLVDELVDAYVGWRDACAMVDDAYRAWTLEADPGKGVGFWLYMAALDAEELAADAYAALVRRTYEQLWGKGPPAEAQGARGVGWWT
jgi:hypothetical protein